MSTPLQTTTPDDAVVDITYVLATCGIRMQPEALRALRGLFDRSLGTFLREGITTPDNRDVWNDPQCEFFKHFILDRVVRTIAWRVRWNADDYSTQTGELDAEMISKACIDVMHNEDIRAECRKVLDRLKNVLGIQIRTPACGDIYWLL